MTQRQLFTFDELPKVADARLAQQRYERQLQVSVYLDLAYRLTVENGHKTEVLADAIAQAKADLNTLAQLAGAPIYPRLHPKEIVTSDVCSIYIDECGSHTLEDKDRFKAFSLAAVIIRAEDHGVVDRKWKQWKRYYLGAARKIVHEPDIRGGDHSFWCGGSTIQRLRAIRALDSVLGRLKFTAAVCVLDRERYLHELGGATLDHIVPQHTYRMTVSMLAEQLAMVLHHEFRGARGSLVFESRGPKEDAEVQFDFARLFSDGTSRISASWFRRQFLPGLQFYSKGKNSTVLQLADLLARSCGEKVLSPELDPPRWQAFMLKLSSVPLGDHMKAGLRVIPWDDIYSGICKEVA